MGTYSNWSSLPGLIIAASIISGLFVAAITKTCCLSSNPYISVNNWFTTLSLELFPSYPLLGHNASSSSKNIIQG